MCAREAVLSGKRLAADLASATMFAALTAVGARLLFHIPGTPVPVTGQVFCVLLAGAVLGPGLGFLSQAEYLAAGAAGLPVFAHGGGPAALLGPTGGYLVGFPLAAFATGLLANSRWKQRGWRRLADLWAWAGCLLGLVIIYALGSGWLCTWRALTGQTVDLATVLAQSVLPFLAVDLVKASAAAAAAPVVRGRLGRG